MKPEDFISAGYKDCPVPYHQKEWACAFYQKAVRDARGIRYFIDAFYANSLPSVQPTIELQFSATGMGTMNIQLFNFEIKEVFILEAFIQKMWLASGGVYYDE